MRFLNAIYNFISCIAATDIRVHPETPLSNCRHGEFYFIRAERFLYDIGQNDNCRNILANLPLNDET